FPKEELLEQIGRRKETIEEVAKEIVSEAVGLGRIGILLDASPTTDSKPYLALYKAESIINWQEALGEEGLEPVEVVLEEEVEERDPEDPFEVKSKIQYRV